MAIAEFRVAGLTDGSFRAPAGGCWIQGVNPDDRVGRTFFGDQEAGTGFTITTRPPTYYPQGYPLPVGTTQYAVLYSNVGTKGGITPEGKQIWINNRIAPYIPAAYTPRRVERAQALVNRTRRQAEADAIRFGWTREQIGIVLRGDLAFQAALRTVNNWQSGGLGPGEYFWGRPTILIYDVGLSPAARTEQKDKLWADIQLALRDSP